jgi:glycosyltransferase involved in cell wall biosynthesis
VPRTLAPPEAPPASAGVGASLDIAWVVDVFDGVKTGGVISAQRFVEALRRRHRVTVIATGPPGPDRVSLPAFRVPGFGGVMREMGFDFALPLRRPLEEVIRRADVVHVQFPFPLGVRAASIARRLGKPLVAGFHVQPENLFRNVGIRWEALSDWTYRLFLRTLYRKADAVVCPSEFAAAELRRRGLGVETRVISNGIAPEFRPVAAERPERHRGRFLLLAVGRLAREKRLDVVVEGVRRSRQAHRIQLVVTGRGPERERIVRLGAGLPLPAEVTFVSDEELRRLLVTADLLVHASEVELEGMAVLEALGCGLPALIADARWSAAPHLATSPELVFRAGDPGDLARRLDAIAESPALLREARERCLEMAPAYRLEESVRRLEAVYRQVVRRSPALIPGAGASRAG